VLEVAEKVVSHVSNGVWDFIDKRQIFRRIMTMGTFAVVVQTILWAQHFVETTTKSDAGVALMLGAVTGPISLLMGYMFSTYQQSKTEV
jgi:hypothetical protein